MSHIDQGNYRGKHDTTVRVSETIRKAVEAKAKDTRLSCAAASQIAKELDISMEEVGKAADFLEIKVDRCQLGLFGYTRSKGKKRIMEPANDVDPRLEAAIRNRLQNGKLPCLAQWEIATELGIKKIDVCAAADGLGIKSSICQLGAF